MYYQNFKNYVGHGIPVHKLGQSTTTMCCKQTTNVYIDMYMYYVYVVWEEFRERGVFLAILLQNE